MTWSVIAQVVFQAMTIPEAAAEVIREALRRSRIDDPVVYLIEATPDRELPPEIADAVRHGASDESIREVFPKATDMPRFLFPAIYPRTGFRRLFSKQVGEFLFVCPADLRVMMKDAVLDVARRGLVLKDANGTVVKPRPATM